MAAGLAGGTIGGTGSHLLDEHAHGCASSRQPLPELPVRTTRIKDDAVLPPHYKPRVQQIPAVHRLGSPELLHVHADLSDRTGRPQKRVNLAADHA